MDQLFADETVTSLGSAGTVVWPLGDHLGTLRDLVTYNSGTDDATLANHREYDSFGNLTDETNSSVDLLFGFTGRSFDETTGLQNNLNRWYDPAMGRWVSEDPIGFAAADANLSRHVSNSPIALTDSTGLFSDPDLAEVFRAFDSPDFSIREQAGRILDGMIVSASDVDQLIRYMAGIMHSTEQDLRGERAWQSAVGRLMRDTLRNLEIKGKVSVCLEVGALTSDWEAGKRDASRIVFNQFKRDHDNTLRRYNQMFSRHEAREYAARYEFSSVLTEWGIDEGRFSIENTMFADTIAFFDRVRSSNPTQCSVMVTVEYSWRYSDRQNASLKYNVTSSEGESQSQSHSYTMHPGRPAF